VANLHHVDRKPYAEPSPAPIRVLSRGPAGSLIPGARVQRRTDDLPVLHLEPEVPAASTWELTVDGLVAHPSSWPLEEVQAMAAEKRVWDLNCVWGWTRPGCEWEGVPAARLIDAACPLLEARYVLATAIGGHYSSCFTLNRARRCLLAWRLDGAELSPAHGWPLRLVAPPTKWAYKGVKWISRLSLINEFTPGFWENLVGDAHGDIPIQILGHLEDQVLEER
jgi:DMSO/TMAO reductase YedYZ molybdopterin-dependent catalytic subunit